MVGLPSMLVRSNIHTNYFMVFICVSFRIVIINGISYALFIDCSMFIEWKLLVDIRFQECCWVA